MQEDIELRRRNAMGRMAVAERQALEQLSKQTSVHVWQTMHRLFLQNKLTDAHVCLDSVLEQLSSCST